MKLNVGKLVGWIFTMIVMIFLIFITFVPIAIREQVDSSYWTNFFVNSCVMLLLFSVWYPASKLKAEQEDVDYIKQRTEYSKQVQKVVDNEEFENLHEFCEYATDINKQNKIKNYLDKYNISKEIYEMCKIDLDLIDENEILTNKQKRKLRKLIHKGIRVKKINSSKITTGIKNQKEEYDTNSDESLYDSFIIINRLITTVVCSCVVAYTMFNDIMVTWAKVAQLCTWFLIIAWTIFTSSNSGRIAVSVYRTNYYKKLRTFLEEFFASKYSKKQTFIINQEAINNNNSQNHFGILKNIQDTDNQNK